jgi:DNA-binding response OmpR family regulator
MHFADLSLDVSRRTAKRGAREIQLSRREFDLLMAFMRNPDRAISREHLLDMVWGMDNEVGLSTVDTYISYLRAKVDVENERKLIHTVRGIGYTLRDEL